MSYTTVAAIDFGTTNIGCAFSLSKDCDEIFTIKIDGEKERIANSVLLNQQGQLDTIGAAAKEKFSNLHDNNDHKHWHLFEGYKLVLQQDRLTRDVLVKDKNGMTYRAISLFRIVIGHFKSKVEDVIKNAIAGFQDSNIKWVITVPAIWSDAAKQFMREAGVAAGIEREQLLLCLEPEAASLYCLHQPNQMTKNEDGTIGTEKFKKGEKYIIADLGGGTADICVHEVIDDTTVREIHRATGNLAGGNQVNAAFDKYLKDLLGFQIWAEIKNEESNDYLELISEFEKKKRHFEEAQHLDSNTNINIRIPFDVLQKFEKVDKARFRKDKLVLNEEVVKDLFNPTVNEIVIEILTILKAIEESGERITTLLVVGGFSESKYLQQRIRLHFQDFRLIFPPDGSLAVMKGAVMMGFRPRSVAERRSRYTYGFFSMEPFVEGKHPESLKRIHDGIVTCDNVFLKQIIRGQILRFGDTFPSLSYLTFKEKGLKHHKVLESVYRSNKLDPTYCIEEDGCVLVGEITIEPPECGWDDYVKFEKQLIVGETEFEVKTKDSQTSREYTTKIDFL